MNRGLRLFGHPVHPMLTDFPLALLSVAPLWDLIGIWRGENIWWAISFWDVALGLIAAVATAATGIIDFLAIRSDEKAAETGVYHMMLMISAVALFVAGLAVQKAPATPAPGRVAIVLALEILGLAVLGGGGWFGGHLVFHYGAGRDTDQPQDRER